MNTETYTPSTSEEKEEAFRLAAELFREVLNDLRGTDPILDSMLAHHLPLTRETYLAIAGLEEPLHIEMEMELPVPFQKNPAKEY